MAKDNSPVPQNLTAVYIAVGLLSAWFIYLTVQHHRMMRVLSHKSLCKAAKDCQTAAAAASTTTPTTTPTGPVVAPLTTQQGQMRSATRGPALTHTNFADCFNYQVAQKNPNGVASFIQNEIATVGNLPFQLLGSAGCGGAGCPHTPDQCYGFWQQYAQNQAVAN